MEQENKDLKLKLKINDEQLKGVYANQIAIIHSKYDFVIDFIAMFPPEAIVNARVVTNPSALKRIYNAIGINLKNYESKFGVIDTGDDIDVKEKIN